MSGKQTIPLLNPNTLFNEKNHNEIPITIMKWIVYSYMTFLITGDQGAGKSTLLKSLVDFYELSAAIRLNELKPELNLRYAYPYRNIVSFCETPTISVQDGLDFQKKTSGTVNLIGEIATALAATWFVQTTKVASKSGGGTHHANTVDDLVSSFTINIAQTLNFNDMKAIEVMVADAIDFDIHMTREKGFRFCERISEINAVKTENYPFPTLEISKMTEADKRMLAMNTNLTEFQKRMTDRPTYEETVIVEYDKRNDRYILANEFTEQTKRRIRKNLSSEDEERFLMDMDRIKQLNAS